MCHDIYPVRPITTVSLAANTYYMMDCHSSSTPRTVGPGSNLALRVNRATGQRIQQEAICYQWFKQRLILSVSEPSISQRSQIKEDTVEPSVPARENLISSKGAGSYLAGMAVAIPILNVDGRRHTNNFSKDILYVVIIMKIQSQ